MSGFAEVDQVHTRLLRCTLEVDNSRAYWERADGTHRPVLPHLAFSEYWFGAKSFPRVQLLLAEFRHRYDAYPSALQVLHAWKEMSPETRSVLCHWHLQLADPLYRRLTGEHLVLRREEQRIEVSRDPVARWVEQQVQGRWSLPTCLQIASKMLSAACSAGLVTGNRDPRRLRCPFISDEALTYWLYLLREIQFHGTLLDNPYLLSVGLAGDTLQRRLARLPALRFRRQGTLTEVDWRFDSLAAWASATVTQAVPVELRGAS